MSDKPTTMRAKVFVESVEPIGNCERLTFRAVAKSGGYPSDGSDEDNNYARWSPSASFQIDVANPALHGQFEIGKKFYVDFTQAD